MTRPAQTFTRCLSLPLTNSVDNMLRACQTRSLPVTRVCQGCVPRNILVKQPGHQIRKSSPLSSPHRTLGSRQITRAIFPFDLAWAPDVNAAVRKGYLRVPGNWGEPFSATTDFRISILSEAQDEFYPHPCILYMHTTCWLRNNCAAVSKQCDTTRCQ